MNADYHHLAKVLDLLVAIAPTRVLETADGEALYAPLIRRYVPSVTEVELADPEAAHLVRKKFDVVLFRVDSDDHHATLDHARALLQKHRGLIVVANKPDWDKADFAAVGNALFITDPACVIAYLGSSSDIKKIRRALLRGRVRRQLTGASKGRLTR